MSTSQVRYVFVDILRGIAILLIVYGHITPGALPFLSDYVSTFHIPLFFFVSGLLYNETKYSSNFRGFVAERAKGLLLPFVVFSIIVAIAYAFVTENYALFLTNLFTNGWGGVALWFIPVLLMVELVFWPLRKLPFFVVVLLLIGSAVLSYISSQKIGMVSNNVLLTFCGLWFYGIGNLCRPLLKHIAVIKHKYVYLLFTALGFTGSLLYLPFGTLPEWFINKIPHPVFYVTPLFAIIGMIGLSLLIEIFINRYIVLFFSTCGKNSLIILAFHQIICLIAQQFVSSKVAILIMVIILVFMVWFIPNYLPWVLGRTKKSSPRLSSN